MASIVYQLNVSYFNQAEEFTKVDNYLDTYAGEDATVVKSSDKNYNVTTHVDEAADLQLVGIFDTISQIKNLTKVKVTVGEESTEGIDVASLKEFLNSKLHYEVTWPAANVIIEITAGEEVASYTLVVTSDYDQLDTAGAIINAVFAENIDNDQLSITNQSGDGLSWTETVLKVVPSLLTDTIGFGDMLKSIPFLSKVVFTLNPVAGEQKLVEIAAPIDAGKLATLKEFMSANLPADDTVEKMTSTVMFYYTNVNGVDAHFNTLSSFVTSSWIADPEATIGTARYHTVAEALAAAKAEDTVKLEKDITVSNNQVNATPNNPVIVIPTGITFDGADHTITADNETWVGTNANHILGASNAVSTIKNLTVIGNEKTKSGIVCFGSAANVTLENVTAQNCGNCGVQVAGATVVANGLHTSGNAWGGVNVDKGSDGSKPSFTVGTGCTFAENAEVYTEITDQDVVTAPELTKIQGFGATLKGFIYYTSDRSRLGTIVNDDETVVYETMNDAASAEGSVSVKLTENISGINTIPAGKTITIDGQGATVAGQFKLQAEGTGTSKVTLKNMTLAGADSGTTYGIISQNQTDNNQMDCELTLENVNMNGYASKAIYGTNIKLLNITGGTFNNCAIGAMDDPNTKGDYAIDLNLVAVKDVVVNIDGATFTGDLGDKAAIKITQRGGASDAAAGDIPKNVGEASVEKVTIQNCDFSGSTTEVDFRIGTDNKTGGDSLNTTGHYAVELVGNTEMVVQSAYQVNEPKLTVPQGRTASKTADTDIAIDLTTEEKMDNIMIDIPGATETSNNVYSISADSTLDLSFIDEIVAIEGYTGMTVANGALNANHTAGEPVDTLKSTIQGWLPDANSDPSITLTITVSFTE